MRKQASTKKVVLVRSKEQSNALPYIAEGDVRRGNRLPLLTSPSAMYGNALPYIAEGDVRRGNRLPYILTSPKAMLEGDDLKLRRVFIIDIKAGIRKPCFYIDYEPWKKSQLETKNLNKNRNKNIFPKNLRLIFLFKVFVGLCPSFVTLLLFTFNERKYQKLLQTYNRSGFLLSLYKKGCASSMRSLAAHRNLKKKHILQKDVLVDLINKKKTRCKIYKLIFFPKTGSIFLQSQRVFFIKKDY